MCLFVSSRLAYGPRTPKNTMLGPGMSVFFLASPGGADPFAAFEWHLGGLNRSGTRRHEET